MIAKKEGERIREQKKREMMKFFCIKLFFIIIIWTVFQVPWSFLSFLISDSFSFPTDVSLWLFSYHTVQPKHQWASSEYMCKVNLFGLPLGFASFPSEHPDSITSSVFEGYTHRRTYIDLCTTDWHKQYIMTYQRHWPENSNCCL